MDIAGANVTVVGLGKTALGLVHLLLREEAIPFVTEQREQSEVAEAADELASLNVPFECGRHSGRAVNSADILIPSPGVSLHAPIIGEARDTGVEITGEMELASHFCDAPIVAVTGTNGKTTTTELIRSLIAACGYRVTLAGNNAYPFSLAVLESDPPDYVVLEVSSYQLELVRHFRPWVAVLLNISTDHLERHGTLEDYARVKARIFMNQQADDVAVYNADDGACRKCAADIDAATKPFSVTHPVPDGLWVEDRAIMDGPERIAEADDVLLPGRHNLANALAALAAVRGGKFDTQRVREGLRDFEGVEHRIEHVATIDGVQYYNDSKSTNLDSLRVALTSFDAPIVLIAGGRGKGSDYGVLRSEVGKRVKALVVMGEDAPALEAAYADVSPTIRAPTMETAVRVAADRADDGDIVLLSPACASFDMYRNFEERGQVFKACVRTLTEVGHHAT